MQPYIQAAIHIHTYIHTGRHTGIQTYRHTYIEANMAKRGIQSERQAYALEGGQTHNHPHTHINRHTNTP